MAATTSTRRNNDHNKNNDTIPLEASSNRSAVQEWSDTRRDGCWCSWTLRQTHQTLWFLPNLRASSLWTFPLRRIFPFVFGRIFRRALGLPRMVRRCIHKVGGHGIINIEVVDRLMMYVIPHVVASWWWFIWFIHSHRFYSLPDSFYKCILLLFWILLNLPYHTMLLYS
jgi:hypothetical protein